VIDFFIQHRDSFAEKLIVQDHFFFMLTRGLVYFRNPGLFVLACAFEKSFIIEDKTFCEGFIVMGKGT
jgi:hypothetical protein